MKTRYKLVLSNKNIYKEIELSPSENEIRIGTSIDCQIRLRKDLFFEQMELTLINKNDNWNIICSDNYYISLGDVRKLVSKDLAHGDSLSINYQKSNNQALHIDYLIDFNDGKIKYERAISINNANRILFSRSSSADIIINSEYAQNDQIILRKTTNGSYVLDIINTTYGVYINGKKSMNGAEIKNGDFFSISDCFFYYKNGFFWTEKSDRIIARTFPVMETPDLNTYPEFIRNTRLKKVIDEEKIEILDPPSKPEKPRANLLMKLLPSVGMMAGAAVMAMMGGTTMIIISGISAVMAVVTAVIGVFQDKKNFKQTTDDRITKYTNYIENKRKEIENSRNKEIKVLNEIYISSNDELIRFDNFSNDLFDRNKDDEDFMSVRLGSGQIKAKKEINFKKQEKLEVEDDLQQKPEELFNEFEYLHDAPIICDFKSTNAIGIVGTLGQRFTQMKNIVFDLMARQHYDDIELFFIAENKHKDYVRWLRMVPFVYNKTLKIPNVVCDDESKNVIFEYLYKEFSTRKEQKKHDHHIVVFFFDKYGFMNHPISKFIENAKSLDVTFVFFADTLNSIFDGCGQIISVIDDNNAVLIDSLNSNKRKEFVYTTISDDKAHSIINMLAPVYTEDISLEGSLTKNLSFFDLLNIISVDDISLAQNWSNSKVYNSMSAPLGVSKTGVVSLDLHDKAHGPHGLVAGTTGSGKSEILQTYILSMITLFHPYEVGFVIIDFKGGGMVNQFKEVPHLLGAITNIDGKAINRSLKSIKAELQKRQRLFAESEVNHIDKYIKKYKNGEVSEPLPHLIIIVDEFAELKAEQPEFMKELISAARIGRSLGVHLILATQKPSGQVNDQIWSNSRFKLCLKVQGKEDSNEVLKSPLAAEIKEPGRAYLQVGNNEIFELFQSAYSGVSDRPDVSGQKEFSIYSIDESGKRTPVFVQKKANKDNNEESTQLTAVVDCVSKYCFDNNIDKLPDICLPQLEEIISFPVDKDERIENLSSDIIVDLGIYDDPDNQYQGKYFVNLSQQNMMIIGSALSGKTNLLQTIIRSLATDYSPSDVNIYIMDFASMILKSFDNLNHVGGVVTISEDEKFKNLMKLMKTEIDVRKEKMIEKGVSSFSAYKDAGYLDLPHIVLIIDNFSSLKEIYLEEDENILNLCRDGLSVGLTVIMTNPQTAGIGYKYMTNFSTKIALFCNDSSEYSCLLEHCKEKLDDIHGRSLIEIQKEHYECQIYQAFTGEKEYERYEEIKRFIQNQNSQYEGIKAKIIPLIPDILTKTYIDENYANYSNKENSIVVGLDFANVMPYSLDLANMGVVAVSGNESSGKHNFFKYIIDSLDTNHKGLSEVYIVDSISRKLSEYKSKSNVASYDVLPDNAISTIEKVGEKLKDRYMAIASGDDTALDKEKLIVLILNNMECIQEICESTKSHDTLNEIVGKYRNMKVCVILGDIENKLINYSSPDILRIVRDNKHLIFFGDANNIKLFDLPLSQLRNYKKQVNTGECYYIKDNDIVKIKTPLNA